MKRTITIAIGLVAITSSAFAELKPEDKITFRQSGFTFMRWNMGIIKDQVVDNPQNYNKEQIIAAANVIASTANSGIFTLFTSDTEKGKGWKDTRVKPEFFQKADEVKKRANDFSREASELVHVANGGDTAAIKSQFDKLQKACKACHEDFRTKD